MNLAISIIGQSLLVLVVFSESPIFAGALAFILVCDGISRSSS